MQTEVVSHLLPSFLRVLKPLFGLGKGESGREGGGGLILSLAPPKIQGNQRLYTG